MCCFHSTEIVGIALFLVGYLIGFVGAIFLMNGVNCLFWHYAGSLEEQFIQGIPLTTIGFVHFFFMNFLLIYTSIAHLRATFTDPGHIPNGLKAPFPSQYGELVNCKRCKGKETWKPVQAHHCSKCGHCTFKMDHHCKWINNCVGYRNTKYFYQFAISQTIFAACHVVYTLHSAYKLLSSKDMKFIVNYPNYPYAFGLSILSIIAGIPIAYLTFEIVRDQINSLKINQCYVDSLKGLCGKQTTVFEQAKALLGEDYMWWAVPTHPEIKVNYYERVW